jgi:hypothetical protein
VNKRSINPMERLADAEAAAALQSLVLSAKNATDALEFSIITHLNFSDAKLAAFQAALDGRRPLVFTSVRHPVDRTYSHFIQAKCANAAAILGGKIIECDRNETYMNKLLELDSIRNRWSFVRVPSRHNLLYITSVAMQQQQRLRWLNMTLYLLQNAWMKVRACWHSLSWLTLTATPVCVRLC